MQPSYISTLSFLTKERLGEQKSGHFCLWRYTGPTPSIPTNVRGQVPSNFIICVVRETRNNIMRYVRKETLVCEGSQDRQWIASCHPMNNVSLFLKCDLNLRGFMV
jgi:hypothetical protein